jgi:hypothetical protein
MTKSQSDNMTKEQRYAAKQRADGLSLVRVWVPTSVVGKLKQYAAKLRLRLQEK